MDAGISVQLAFVDKNQHQKLTNNQDIFSPLNTFSYGGMS
jgi:hypothetical protein